jgi:hypothetical protein
VTGVSYFASTTKFVHVLAPQLSPKCKLKRGASKKKLIIGRRRKTILFYNPPHSLSLVHHYSKLSACVLTSVSSLNHPECPVLTSFLIWSSSTSSGLPQMQNTMTIIAPSPTCIHTYAQCFASTQFTEERGVNGSGAQEVQLQQ